MIKHLIFVLFIILLTYLSIGKSLDFALNGDDWQSLWRYTKDFTNLQSYFNIRNYSTDYSNYVFANIIMGLIYQLFHFEPFPYYFTSMTIRIITAISFYFAIFAATKSKMAGYLSSIFFTVMFSGIETTNWVFNMNSYISLTLFNIFLSVYFSEQFKILSKKGFAAALLLGLSFITTQNRMHGILFIIPILALIKIHNSERITFKEICQRLIVFYSPIFFYRFLTRGGNDTTYTNTIVNTLSHPLIAFKTLFSSIGNALLPQNFNSWALVSPEKKAIITILMLLVLCWFFNKLKNEYRQYYTLAFLCLAIIPSFLIMPLLLFDSSATLTSDHRYLIIPGAYIMVIYALICSLLWKNKNQFPKIISVTLIFLVIVINFSSLKNYFSILSDNGRLKIDSEKQFKYIYQQIEKPNNNAPIVFLFISDNPYYLYNAITFGFSYHYILTNRGFVLDLQKAPFAVDNIESLINILSSEDSPELKRFGYSKVKVPMENVYVFRLQNKNLTNITLQARNYLREQLNYPKSF